jgi:predicted DNA-binding transcriptional regulator AlpA
MWLWRKIKYDPTFPRPVIIGNRIYLDEDELDAYDDAAKKAPEACHDR